KIFSPAGDYFGRGYSGHAEGVNNTAAERLHNIGPIPRGFYTIGPAYADEERGAYTMALIPQQGTETFGRAGFLWHGDLLAAPGQKMGSLGCIVSGLSIRKVVAASDDRELDVY